MKEKIIQFGAENNMLGIVTEPESLAQIDVEKQPAILILNSGLVHKVGPYRMAVALARKLAAAGYLVFRFDLPNIGDSSAYQTRLSYRERTISEISSAMDIIARRYHFNHFISMGLCTGAMNSHVIATADPRVSAAVMLDAYAYPTLAYLVKRYASKLYKIFHPAIILRILGKMFVREKYDGEEGVREGIDYWEQPPKKQIAEELTNMMARDVELLYIYSGGVMESYNYENQFVDSFKNIDFKNHLRVRHLEKMDHTYTLQSDRDYMLSLITDWVKEKFPTQD